MNDPSLYRSLTVSAAVLILSLLPGLPRDSAAVPAAPGTFELTQPDGTKVKSSLKGDEFYHWLEDASGYTILKSSPSGHWVYAEPGPGGALRAGNLRPGVHEPSSARLDKHLKDAPALSAAGASRTARDLSAAASGARSRRSPPGKAPILTGTMKNLVILARFSDQTTTYSQAAFDSLFNDTGYTTGGAVGSVKDFYKEISYNSLTVQTTVSQWVTLPHTFAYYGANAAGGDSRPREMVLDAIHALDVDGFDFSAADGNADGEVDGLDIIHSGRGEEYGGNNSDYIWSHMWALSVSTTVDGVSMQTYHTEPELRGYDTDASSEITRIGVICHETGHFLGLPDLYDTTYASSGAGDFCLMASGSWNGVASADGSSPAHMSAWCKKYLGWASPTRITTTGSYSLPKAEDSSTAMYLFKGTGFSSQEYFLAENRQGFGFDAGLPGTSRGVLIWHVDESKLGNGDNDDPTHYLVDLMEAGGTQDLELAPGVGGDDSDYYRSGRNLSFDDYSTPGGTSYDGKSLDLSLQNFSDSANTMSFSLIGVAVPTPAVVAYPQPWRPGSGGMHDAAGMTFDNVPDDAEVQIYNIVGERIVGFTVLRSDLNRKLWDGRNSAGNNVASGVYFVLVKAPGRDTQTLKIAIER